jgi:hypothetical protein
MNAEVVAELRTRRKDLSPSQIVAKYREWESQALPSGSRQFSFIAHFKAAFPDIPLRILTEASTSLFADGLSNVELDELMAPWLRRKSPEDDLT